jgi:hypothetical protein
MVVQDSGPQDVENDSAQTKNRRRRVVGGGADRPNDKESTAHEEGAEHEHGAATKSVRRKGHDGQHDNELAAPEDESDLDRVGDADVEESDNEVIVDHGDYGGKHPQTVTSRITWTHYPCLAADRS